MNIHPNSIVPIQPKNSVVSIDTEFFGMTKKRLHRPHGQFACMTVCTGEDVYIVFNEKYVEEMLLHIENSVWVFQNAKFDIGQLRRYADIPPRKKIWDIMLVERIMYGGYFDEFSLVAMNRRYLDRIMEKDTREEFIKSSAMTQEMVRYACYDAYSTLKIYECQRRKVDRNDFRVWTEVDRPALWAVLDFQGIVIDSDKWLALAQTNRDRAKALDAQLDFNPRSPKQVLPVLQKNGFKGLKSTGEAEIERAAKKYPNSVAAKLSQTILDSRMYTKRAGTYGETMFNEFSEVELVDGQEVRTFIADFKITGAESGRMSCSNPDMQNIPARETKEFRECFIARPKHKLVVLDYSAQEPCITAYLSQDKRLKQIFIDGLDVYCEMYYDLKGEKITKKDKPKRSRMKPVFLGATYGLSKYGLSKKEDIPLDEAEELLNSFFKKYPGVARWIKKQQKIHKYVETVMGRKSWLNPYTNQSERNALNAPVQGSAGDMLKMALGRIHQQWNDNFECKFGVVVVVHDEIVLDVPEELAEEVGKFCSKIMVDVGEEMLGHQIPMKADYSVCDNWSQKG